MKRAARNILFVFCAWLILGCTPDPWEAVSESLNELETILSTNMERPENVIGALDNYLERNHIIWRQNEEYFEKASVSEIERKINAYKQNYNERMRRILDLDLEMQDQLARDPVLLQQYMERIHRIGQ